jgi:hypothetical protein
MVVLIGAALAAAALAHGQAPATYRIDTLVAGLNAPSDLAPLPTGGLLVADTANNRVVRVDPGGTITSLATDLSAPRGVSAVPGGGFLVADTGASVIRRYAADGTMTIVAGSPNKPGFSGDGSAATRAQLDQPQGVTALADGSFLVADTANQRIRRVSDGVITTVAGTGTAGFSGDGGPATSAQLNAPARVVALAGGGFLVADTANSRIRRVDIARTITTVAGPTGLTAPEGVAVRSDGSLVIADTGGQRVRELGADGTLRTIAGTAGAGFSGDGGDATAAQLNTPRAVALGSAGVLIADTANNRIRALTPTAPTTTTTTPITDPLPEPAATPPPGVAPPRTGQAAVVAPVRGVVRVRLAGHRGFTTLREATNIGVGTELDTTKGAVALFFATSSDTGAAAVASLGRFVVLQPRRPVVDGERPGLLVLSQPLAGCRRTKRLTATTAAARTHKRKLKVRAKGKIRTKGKYGSAIVLGTQWTITDRCPAGRPGSTTEHTIEGLVQVRDFVKHRTVRVPAGRSYTARARR